MKKIIEMYRVKKDIMLKTMEEEMPEGVTWTIPEGGLFLFVTLPEGCDTTEMFKKAIEKKVAYVTGTSFYCNGEGKNTMRMNFSYASIEDNKEGIRRLAEVIKDFIR